MDEIDSAGPRTALDAERFQLGEELGSGHRGAGPDDLRLAGRRRDPGVRAAARPRPARPPPPQLALVDAALARLDDGTFGNCTRCGKPIAPARWRRCRGPRTASIAKLVADRANAADDRAGTASNSVVGPTRIRAAAATLAA